MSENLPVVMERQPQQNNSLFLNISAFEDGQRMASVLTKSQLIPETFRGNLADCMIALELAMRIGASPMAVLQNTYIVHGKPGYSATFIISMINTCGRYSPLRFEFDGEGDDRTCVAWANELSTGERLDGPPISIDIAKKEGWFQKKGSKWQTMPELMLRYRAATFFGRIYAPELLMGMRSVEELRDVDYKAPADEAPKIKDLNEAFTEKEPVEELSNDVPKKEQETILRQPGEVAKFIKEVGKILSLETFEVWLKGCEAVINKAVKHNGDREEIKNFVTEHHSKLIENREKFPKDETEENVEEMVNEVMQVDEDFLSAEIKKLNKCKTSDGIDRWLHANFPRLDSSTNGETIAAINKHAADVRAILSGDENEKYEK